MVIGWTNLNYINAYVKYFIFKEHTMTLGLNFVRGQYPIFQNPETIQWAFFENAGGSYWTYGVMKICIFFIAQQKCIKK